MSFEREVGQENAALSAELDGGDFWKAMFFREERLPERQYCVFRAGRERFCFSVLEVEEVVDWPIVTRIPLSPAFLMGVFNLRGTIVPLIDIAFTEGRRPGLASEARSRRGAQRRCAARRSCGWELPRTK